MACNVTRLVMGWMGIAWNQSAASVFIPATGWVSAAAVVGARGWGEIRGRTGNLTVIPAVQLTNDVHNPDVDIHNVGPTLTTDGIYDPNLRHRRLPVRPRRVGGSVVGRHHARHGEHRRGRGTHPVVGISSIGNPRRARTTCAGHPHQCGCGWLRWKECVTSLIQGSTSHRTSLLGVPRGAAPSHPAAPEGRAGHRHSGMRMWQSPSGLLCRRKRTACSWSQSSTSQKSMSTCS